MTPDQGYSNIFQIVSTIHILYRGSGAGVCQKRRFVETGKGEKVEMDFLTSLYT